MTWHLKDRELEKKLIEIAPDFVESLNESLKLGEYEENSRTYEILFGPYEGCYKFEMHVYDDELEDVPEYNPKAWNDSRKVTPPENVIFMAKVYRTSLCEQIGVYYKALIYKDSKWYYVINGESSDTQMYLYEGDYVEFKAWEN